MKNILSKREIKYYTWLWFIVGSFIFSKIKIKVVGMEIKLYL